GMSGSRLAAVAALVALAIVPWGLARHQLSLLTDLLISGLFAMSLDLIMGYTGMVSFGHAAYFGLGAYATALRLLHFAHPAPLARAAGRRRRRAGRLVFDARHRHLLRDAHAGLRAVPLYGGLQVARSHRRLRRHRGRAEDIAVLGRAEPGLAERVLFPGGGLRRAVAGALPRRRALAVRPRAPGDP